MGGKDVTGPPEGPGHAGVPVLAGPRLDTRGGVEAQTCHPDINGNKEKDFSLKYHREPHARRRRPPGPRVAPRPPSRPLARRRAPRA